MTIVYSCVANGTTVLCSHQIGAGSFETVVESILRNIPTRNDGKTTYSSDSYMFHCEIANGIVFLCAAKADFGKKQPYAFLAEIKRKFQSGTMAMRAVTPRSHELDGEFGMVLGQNMEKFSKPANDNLSMLRSQVDEVKDVMTQNIEKVLERGERLDDLVDKTNDLEASAQTFQKTATKLRRKYWWKNTKMMMILAVVIFVVLTIVVLLILYGAGVFNSSSSPSPTTTPAPALPSTSRSNGR